MKLCIYLLGLPRWLSSKESPCDARDPGLIPGSGRSTGGRNGNPLQYSCLENPTDRGTWWARVHGVTKSWTRLSDLASICICILTRHCHSHPVMEAKTTKAGLLFSQCKSIRVSQVHYANTVHDDLFLLTPLLRRSQVFCAGSACRMCIQKILHLEE